MILKKMNIGEEILAYREFGTGSRTLLLIHGNMSSSLHFDTLMMALKEEFKIYAPDLRGFGESSYYGTFDSLKELSDDLEFFADKLRLKNIELVGWSTGGGIALQFAADYPDLVNRVTLLESVGLSGYPMFKKDDQFQAILDQPLWTKEEIKGDPVQVAPVLKAIESGDYGFYKALWDAAIYTGGKKPEATAYDVYVSEMLKQRNLVDLDYALTRFNMTSLDHVYGKGTGDIKKVKCPVLIVHGAQDIVVPMTMAEEIHTHLESTKRLVVLDPCGHNPMVDQLEQVVNLITEAI